MRTTIDIPNHLLKKAKMKAIEEEISLKELFTRLLEKELSGELESSASKQWKILQGKGSSSSLDPETSGFEGYSGPDWNQSIQVNDPDKK
ncbi:MAG: hypothetical protein ACFCU6_16380 [Balneolaceae bacterium]